MRWRELKLDDRVDVIKSSWQPNYSAAALAAAVARRLGDGSKVTKGSIVSIYHRRQDIKLTHPLGGKRFTSEPGSQQLQVHSGDAIQRRNSRRQRMAKKAVQNETPAMVKAPAVALRPENVAYDTLSLTMGTARPLTELVSGQCKWSVNSPPPGGVHLFCAEPIVEGKPYCQHHQNRAIQRKA